MTEQARGHGEATHKGRVRDLNEDSYVADPQLGLWIVADGMGGHECGEVASRIAADFIHEQLTHGVGLQEATARAHDVVTLAAQDGLGQPGMGSTLVALQLRDARYEVVWVGDSRAYLWQDGALRQLTRDHSFVQKMLDEGQISSAEAVNHPYRNVITQALGVADLDRVDVGSVSGTLCRGEIVLLCSDGLTGEVSEDEIGTLLHGADNLQDAAQALVASALEHGGSDNITVLLVPAPAGAPLHDRGAAQAFDEPTVTLNLEDPSATNSNR